ncbi:hypothetical protein Q8W15_16385 [Photobacterium damselae subsp. piscicida]|nr:hypothetical protein [Photobacterium damselae subsp. piscicida]MDP2543330.1 hypothetical protein [Photobacterium damselae subsp. piscicida]MDP2558436.1 hypothetical protein [Photobacterium damselae subsp. piscicida]
MTAGSVFLNPFTHIATVEQKAGLTFSEASNLKPSEGHDGDDAHPLASILGDITGLIASMAAPNTDLNDTLDSALSDAILRAWDRHKQDTLIESCARGTV